MPEFLTPGVYFEEINPGMRPIEGVPTTVAVFVGFAESGPLIPTLVTSFSEYGANFGGFANSGYLPYAVQGFFQNGGTRCFVLRVTSPTQSPKLVKKPASAKAVVKPGPVGAASKLAPVVVLDASQALADLDALNDIAIVCCPDEHSIAGMTAALVAHCERLRYRIAVLGSPMGSDLSNTPPREAQSSYAAYYAPWVRVTNPNGGAAIPVHPGGHIAGAMVANDMQRGVHKAPANLPIAGIVGLERNISAEQQSELNPRGVNVIRNFPARANLIWGARTTSDDPEWKYVNVRRLLIYLENSIEQGTQWAVFEPNGEQLWANVRQTIENFLFNVWRDGALLGNTPDEAYFVRCDRTTMTQDDLDNGRLVCLVGVAVVKPAEFVVFRIGQRTADAKA